ncbi:MAG: transferrin receptor-like dimerization domain-containing protein [Ignavibacteriaceae bacterium]
MKIFRILLPLIILLVNSAFAQDLKIKELQKEFDSSLNKKDLQNWMKKLSAYPHHLGSSYDRSNALFIDSLFKSFGFDSQIEEFKVLFPTPKTRLLEITAPTKYKANLFEPPLKEDNTSNQADEQLPTYNAYSIDGDVTGELVYANYGIPKDYEVLAEHGIDVKGKIVIVRYGAAWRGIKPKVAAEHGAVGCIIYSDPKGDGYYQGDVYPKGAFRSEDGVQRGSVIDFPQYCGDPLTPFVAATENANRLEIKDAKTLTKIPVIPISYGDALHFLSELEGPVVPENWRGALPVTYHMGPGKAKVHLKVESNWDMVPLRDVIAKIPGEDYPDEWIIRGNHYDAWVNGAGDPIGGLVALLEEAKMFGDLLKTGWRPKRTIIYCAWDGEEEGLFGSTEWVEKHTDELKQKAVAYINSDGNGRGFLYAGGSHTLEHFVNRIADDINDPEMNISAAKRWRSRLLVNGSEEEKKDAMDNEDLNIYPLGSGSDYSPFLQHIGVASLNISFGGEDNGGEYHSIYDSYDHYIRFGDPGFEYGIALAKTSGHAILNLSESEILPFNFENFSNTVREYFNEISKLTDKMRKETSDQNKMLDNSDYLYASDPTKTYILPENKDPVPFINFAPLQNSLTNLENSSNGYERAVRSLKEYKIKLTTSELINLNEILLTTERFLTNKDGLPNRPWYIHEIYAPGFYTGYGVKTLPAIREAIEQRNWKQADEQIEIVAHIFDRFSKQIDKATQIVNNRLNQKN